MNHLRYILCIDIKNVEIIPFQLKDRETEKQSYLLSSGSLSKCLQQSELDETKARSQVFNLGLSLGCQEPMYFLQDTQYQ